VVLRRVLRHSKLREGIAHASRSTAAGARRSTTTRADATHVGWGWELTWSDVPHAQERSSARNEAATKTSSRDEEALRRRATNDQVHAHSNIRVPSLLVTRNKINPLLSLFAFARLDCVDRVGGLYAAGPVGPDAHGIVAQKTWCIVVVGWQTPLLASDRCSVFVLERRRRRCIVVLGSRGRRGWCRRGWCRGSRGCSCAR